MQEALAEVHGVERVEVPGRESGRARVQADEGVEPRSLIEAVRSAGNRADLESGGRRARPSGDETGDQGSPDLLPLGAGSDWLLETYILAREGGEIVQIAALTIRFRITVSQLTETLFPYLTLAEGLKLGARVFEKDVTKPSCRAG